MVWNKFPVTLAFLTVALSRAATPPATAPALAQADAARFAAQQSLEKQALSLDKQRQSIHRQVSKPFDTMGIPIADFIAPLPTVPQAPCPALDRDDISTLVDEAARKQEISRDLLRAVMKRESAFRPCAVSPRGAQGLMQLLPATAEQFHVSDPFDPNQNVQAGASFLKQLLTRYKGDLRLALGAYNAGPLRADQLSIRPFPVETQKYLTNILADLDMSPANQEDLEQPETTEQPTGKTTPSGAKTEKPQL